MTKFYLLYLLAFLFSPALSQSKKEISYFDRDWMPVKNKKGAVYYRTIDQSDGRYIVKDFYLDNDQVQMEAECSSVKPQIVMDGKATWYHKNGQLETTGICVKGEKTGPWKSYYEDGTLKEDVKYKDGVAIFHQYWDTGGTPLLQNGQGQLVEKDEGKITITEFKDSLITAVYNIEAARNDTVYLLVEKSAEYIGGIQSLYEHVGKELKGKYPKQARRMGVEGRVFIQFVIDKTGEIVESFVLRGIGAGCDEVAMEAFSTLSKWNPAMHENKPVKQMMVLPVVFRLN